MNVKMQPQVSIVTPVYNEEEHLGECIESILGQTYQNWDYTIVNNCSTDRSLEIASRYAAKDRRIRVLDNSRFLEMLPNLNGAVGRISPASKYCKVVLGDDWIFPSCLERMVAVAEDYPSVGVVSAYELRGEEVRITGLPLEQNFVSGREACSKFLLDKLFLFGSQNSVLYRADLVRNRSPFYDETNMYADFEACFALLSRSDLGFVHDILTFSRPRSTSVGAISADIGAHYGSMLEILFTYGMECLSAEEFAISLNNELSQYYKFLARRVLVDRDSEFWSYHRERFDRVGVEFSYARMMKTMLSEASEVLLHPKSTIESIERLFRLRKIRSRQARSVVLEGGARRASQQHRIEEVSR
jgi:glycosyltransferase involved in cell wall biosynthesis